MPAQPSPDWTTSLTSSRARWATACLCTTATLRWPNGDNHGWVEGALEQVELALTDLIVELGLKDYTKYDPKNLSMLDEFAPPPPPPPPPSVGITTLVAAIVASYVAGAISDSAATTVVASFVGGAVSVLAFQRFLGRGPLSSRRAKTQ